MRAIVYSTGHFERIAFDQANKASLHQLTYVSVPLNEATARLAEGYEALLPRGGRRLRTSSRRRSRERASY